MSKLKLNHFILFLLIFFTGTTAFAQNKNGSIKGQIKTSDGTPAAFVSVGLKGTTKGTTANGEGFYQLTNVKPGTYTLSVSFVGLKTQQTEITVTAGQSVMKNFTLTENAAQLNEVVVTASQTLNKPVSLGKAGLAPIDNPQSTGVITSTIIQDQMAIRLGDVLKNVSGVSLTQNRGGVAETYAARGSLIGIGGGSGSIFKNGIISNTTGFPDASTLESIEVLKGSAALLYGSVSGGIIINMVTKKPRFDWGGEVSMLYGSYNQYKPTVDLYGPITKNLAFRVVATHEDADSYRDVVNTHRTYVNPSLLYKIGKKTDILLEADFLKSDITPDAGLGAPNARITLTEMPVGPRNRFIYPSWVYNNTQQIGTYLTINHRFNDSWKLTSIGGFQNTRVLAFGVGVPMTIPAATTTYVSGGVTKTFYAGDFARNVSATNTDERDLSEQLNLTGTFKTGSIGHQLLFGADFTRVTSESNTFNYKSANGSTSNVYDTLNIYNPGLHTLRTDVPYINTLVRTITPTNRFGVYLQDLISLTSKLKALAGVRVSYQTGYQGNVYTYVTDATTKAGSYSAYHAWSPKFALIYQPVQTTSIYADYTNNFTYNSGTDVNNNPLPASIVDQYEAGVKNEFLNGRLTANLAVYRIQNSNLVQTALFLADGVTQNLNTNFKTLTGQTKSDGVEVDVNATLSKNFYFLAGYSYNFARYTNTSGGTGSQVEGERVVASPDQTANGSIFYTFDKGSIKGLKFGASAFYTGKRTGGNNNQNGPTGLNTTTTNVTPYNSLIPLNPYTTVDLSAGYSWHKLSLLTKVSNIFNTFSYVVHDRYSLNPIPPRMFAATLAYKF